MSIRKMILSGVCLTFFLAVGCQTTENNPHLPLAEKQSISKPTDLLIFPTYTQLTRSAQNSHRIRIRLNFNPSQPAKPTKEFKTQQAPPQNSDIKFVKFSVQDISGQLLVENATPQAVINGEIEALLSVPMGSLMRIVSVAMYDSNQEQIGTPIMGYFRSPQSVEDIDVNLDWLSTPVAQTLLDLYQLNATLAQNTSEHELQFLVNPFLIDFTQKKITKFPAAINTLALSQEINNQGQLPTTINPIWYEPGTLKLRVSGMTAATPIELEVPTLSQTLSFSANGTYTLALPPGKWPLKLTFPAHYFGILPQTITVVANQEEEWKLPVVPNPVANPMTLSKVELGFRLFFEPKLSGNNLMSCATCHDPTKGFSNGEAFATGIDGSIGTRNTPTIYTTAYQTHMFHDGRAADLEEQALMPIQNPIEMNETLPNAIAKLEAIPYYVTKFQETFNTGVTSEGISKALASFQRAIALYETPFERRNEAGYTGFSASAARGENLFNLKACSQCHNGYAFADFSFRNIGVGTTAGIDSGRSHITNNPLDEGKFKTPTLLNIEKTAPYMHDGSQATLEDVINFYDQGGEANPNLDPTITNLGLSAQDKLDLIELLKAFSADDNLSIIANLPGIKLPEEDLPHLPQ